MSHVMCNQRSTKVQVTCQYSCPDCPGIAAATCSRPVNPKRSFYRPSIKQAPEHLTHKANDQVKAFIIAALKDLTPASLEYGRSVTSLATRFKLTPTQVRSINAWTRPNLGGKEHQDKFLKILPKGIIHGS